MQIRRQVAIVASLATASLGAYADEALTEALPMTVTASPIVAEETVTPYGGSVTRIGREQIDGLAALDLASALRRATGITISRFNLVGAYGGDAGGSFAIRGRGTGRPGAEIRTYMDGVPREVGVWSHPLLDTLPIDMVSEISVYKGPQPLLYGGVFGALDATSPRRQTSGYETRVDTSYGEHNTVAVGLQHGGRLGAWDYYVGAATLESDGHREHSAAALRNQYIQSGYTLTDGLRLSYILHRTDNWGEDPGPSGSAVPGRDRFATETVTQSIQLHNIGERFTGYALLYHEDGRIRWPKDNVNGPGTPAGDVDTDWQNYGLRTLQDIRFDAWTVTAALDAEREGGKSRTRTVSGMVPLAFDADYDTVSPALGLRVDIPVADLILTPSVGARYASHSEFGDTVAPQAGLVLGDARWQCFANYADTAHYPGVYVAGVSAATVAGLDAERLEHLEVGVGGTCPLTGAELRLALFRDASSDQLQWSPAGLVNQRASDINGLELSISYAGQHGHSAFAGLTLLDPDAAKTPRAPEVSATAGVVLAPVRDLSVHIDVQYVDAQYAFNGRTAIPGLAGVEKVDAYTVANARVGYAVHSSYWADAEVYVSIENVTDEEYAYQPGYPMAGRTVSLGLRTVF